MFFIALREKLLPSDFDLSTMLFMTEHEEDTLGMYYSVEGACEKHSGVRLDTLEAGAPHAVVIAPRAAITDRKAATSSLKELFSAADTVLKTRMDKLVPILAQAEPAFATDYENARIIVDSGGRVN